MSVRLSGHIVWRHIVAPLWIKTPAKIRWWYAERYCDAAPTRRCWCGIVDSLMVADRWEDEADEFTARGDRHDYDDWCDVPLPWDCGPPRPGSCYCPDLDRLGA